MLIKKFMTKSPVFSIIVFGIFILLFNLILDNFYTDQYETIKGDIIKVNKEDNILVVKNQDDIDFCQEQLVQLVYSSQEKVLKGRIINIDKDIILMKFDKLNNVDEDIVLKSNIKVFVGKENIRRSLEN